MIRELPDTLDKNFFNREMNNIESILSKKWLIKRSKKTNIFKELWKRNDILASVELYTILYSINKFRNQKIWLKSFFQNIKKNTQIESCTNELVTAGFFLANNQDIKLCDVGQPGYDFWINYNNKKIRVSCKKLEESDNEKRFHLFCQKIYDCIPKLLNEFKVNGLQITLFNNNALIFKDMNNEDLKKIQTLYLNFIRKALIDYTINNRKITECVCENKERICFVALHEIDTPNEAICLDSSKVSFKLLISFPAFNEQLRLENLFRRASNNMKKNAGNIDEINSNIIIIRIPSFISLTCFDQWLSKKFCNNYSSISGVILYNIEPVTDLQDNMNFLLYSIKYFDNPNSKVTLKEIIEAKKILHCEIPVGKINDQSNIPYKTIMNDKGDTISLEKRYSFLKGDIFYNLSKIQNVGKYTELINNQEYGVNYYLVQKPILISPTDKLLIV